MIQISRDGPIATIALARPQAKNALPIAAWEALAEAAQRIGDARAVILRSGAPGIFSAGADIREFAQFQSDPALRTRFRESMRAGVEAVAALPMPVIAAIDGGCFGAAVALVLAADIRIAGDGAGFATPPAQLGLAYPQQDVARLREQVGRGAAAKMLFLGDRLNADEAKATGLIEIRAGDAAEAALAMARVIAANAPQAIRQLKRALNGPAGDLDQAFDDAFAGPELAEGLAAFAERRRPVF